MNILSNKSFADYKQAKKEMEALESLLSTIESYRRPLSEEAEINFNIKYSSAANSIYGIVKDWIKIQKEKNK